MTRVPNLKWLRCTFAAMLALGSAGHALSMAQPPARPSTAGISAITLARNCFGCPTGTVLTLRRDGRATYTVTGSARSGTADKTSSGTIATDDFEGLARLAVTGDFFALDESYEDPQTRDGAWATTTITRDGKDKQVFRREAAGPPALGALEAGIDTAKARIRFNP